MQKKITKDKKEKNRPVVDLNKYKKSAPGKNRAKNTHQINMWKD